jgi:class 3 adenylate cyclase/tetratricopeptide (TPR) repeat protein
VNCSSCRAENRPEDRFCTECGAPLDVECSGCGFANRPVAKFCGGCGARLTPLDGRSPSRPDSYSPKRAAESILTSKSALEGERKHVTVLFADLQASMQQLGERDPEEARRVLDPVIEKLMEAVHYYEGTVNQVMGDGIMALFGAPLAHEDHAVRAGYAALRMQEAVKQYAEEVQRTMGVSLHLRVGINSGEVVVRSIGNDLHMDYTAVGQTTHLAGRMEQMALPGSILAAPETVRLTEGYLTVKSLGVRPIKGLELPVEIHEIVGPGAVRSRLHAAAVRGLTRFVGRDRELTQLRRALERSRSGHGQIVGVVGEAGVGKSRLIWEFTHSTDVRGCLVVEASSMSYGRATSYLPVIDLLKAYFRVEERDDQDAIRERVTGKLLALDHSPEPARAPLLALLDVAVADPTWVALAPPLRRQRTLDAVKHLVLRESYRQPVILVFEDLHWIDSETQALLDSLTESLPAASVLLLVSYRPEYRHEWGGKTYYTQLHVNPLAADSVGVLLEELLGSSADLDPLRRVLVERTEGNPFFLEECVRTLVETTVLVGDHGQRRVTRSVEDIRVPATVQAVLAARIDRLPTEEKRLLQSAAVIGKDVPWTILREITDRSTDELRRNLANLQAAEILYETSLFPDVEYTFKHSLAHEVAYSGLLQNRRRALHAAIVGAIERSHPTRLAEHVEQLAEHAVRGEVWDKAVIYARQAGRKAFMRFANQEAVRWFEQALSALEHLAPAKEVLQDAIDVRLDLRNALVPVGEAERVLRHLRQADALAESLNDTRRAGWVSGYTSACHWAMGDYGQALNAIERTRALAAELGEQSLSVYADLALTWTSHSLGDYARGIAAGSEAVEVLRLNPTQEHFGIQSLPAVVAHTWLALCQSERGEFTSAISHGAEAIRLADAAAQPWSLVSACLGLGGVHLRRADSDAARPVLERGLEASRRFDIQVWVPPLAASLGYAYGLAGRVEESVVLLTEAVQQMAASGLHFYHTVALLWLAEAHLLAGRLEEATRLAGQALSRSQSHDEKGNEAYSLRLLGDLAAHSGGSNAASAASHYREARALAVQRGMQPLVAQCHFGLGLLAVRTGTPEAARDDLSVALARFRELGMQYWTDQTLAVLREWKLRA